MTDKIFGITKQRRYVPFPIPVVCGCRLEHEQLPPYMQPELLYLRDDPPEHAVAGPVSHPLAKGPPSLAES